jgi:hypothetical protein
MLRGELAYREGHYAEAWLALQEAVDLDDGLVRQDRQTPWRQPHVMAPALSSVSDGSATVFTRC